MRAFALTLALVLTGCGSLEGDDHADAPDRASAREEPTTLADCLAVEAITKFPAAALAPHLPPGFEPAADATGAFAIVGGADCAEGGARGFVAIQVTPTDDALLSDGVERYYWEPEHYLVQGGDFAEQVLALGATASWADIALAHAPTGASLRIADDAGEHEVELPLGALGPGPEPLAAGLFREYFPARGGYGYLQASFAFEATTPFAVYPSTLRTAEGTTAREIFGAESIVPAGVLEVSYADAIIGFVPYD